MVLAGSRCAGWVRLRPSHNRRRRDNIDLVVALLAIALWTTGFFVIKATIQRQGHDEGQRLTDLRVSCRRASQRLASDVNLNYVYYQSERDLAQNGRRPQALKRDLALLSPGERRFIALLLQGSGPSQKILLVRATADRQAAYVKAQSVDSRDARLVSVNSGLGKDPTPRQWVVRAGFSCTRAYS